MDQIGIAVHGAFRRADALTAFGPYRVRRAQESGEWSTPWPGVLIETSRAADPLTLASAAVQLAGPGTVLCGPTAAALHGCSAVPTVPIHVMVPYGHWLRRRSGLVVHNGPVPDADRTHLHDLPALGLERTLTDVLCTSSSPDALAVADEVLAMIDPEDRDRFRATIATRLRRRRDPRGTRRGERLLDLATGLAESPAESWLLWRIVDSGFPTPEVNWRLKGPDGREIRRLDLAWPKLRIVVEYNGYTFHANRSAEDDARAQDLRRRGWIVITLWADDLRDPGPFERALSDAFRARGVDTSRREVGMLRGRRHRDGYLRGA